MHPGAARHLKRARACRARRTSNACAGSSSVGSGWRRSHSRTLVSPDADRNTSPWCGLLRGRVCGAFAASLRGLLADAWVQAVKELTGASRCRRSPACLIAHAHMCSPLRPSTHSHTEACAHAHTSTRRSHPPGHVVDAVGVAPKRLHAAGALRGPELDRVVPAAGQEQVPLPQVPAHAAGLVLWRRGNVCVGCARLITRVWLVFAAFWDRRCWRFGRS